MSEKNLLDPRENELIPLDDGPTIEPPELAPDHVERLPKIRKETGDLMDFLTKAAEGAAHGCERERVEIAPGLMASHCPSGGLSLFKNGVQVLDRTEMSPDDQAAINDFLERVRK